MIRLLGPFIVILPLIEIAGFVVVGGWLGLGFTLLWVLAAAVCGLALIRMGGINALLRLQSALGEGREPGHSLVDGAALVVAGMLLVLPGFFSDFLALVLVLPVTRDFLLRRAARHFETHGFRAGVYRSGGAHPGSGRQDGARGTTIIEGEFEIVEQGDQPGDQSRRSPPAAGKNP